MARPRHLHVPETLGQQDFIEIRHVKIEDELERNAVPAELTSSVRDPRTESLDGQDIYRVHGKMLGFEMAHHYSHY